MLLSRFSIQWDMFHHFEHLALDLMGKEYDP